MASIEIKNLGPIKHLKEIQLNSLNVFMGKQSSGKSTIVKIISFCLWLEKEAAIHQNLDLFLNPNTYFKDSLEAFHRLKGYFRADSYVHYHSNVIDICWENEQCRMEFVDSYAYVRAKLAYIPAERNIVTLPDASRAEFGKSNIRSFLFDWFEAKKNYSKRKSLSLMNLGINYYYDEVNDEDHISSTGDHSYDILLNNASSGLQTLTPLILILEYLSKSYYKSDSISFENTAARLRVERQIMLDKVFKSFFASENLSMEDYVPCLNKYLSALASSDERAVALNRDYELLCKSLFSINYVQFILEEPEQNLFPSTQKNLMYYLLKDCFMNEKNRVLLTTHSPYILYTINNCMLADMLYDKLSEEERKQLKCVESRISSQKVSLYEIRDGYVELCNNSEDRLLDDNFFDLQMKETMDEFYTLLNYYE